MNSVQIGQKSYEMPPLVLLCYKLDTRLQVFRRMEAGMVVPWLHERQHRYFRRPATTPDELS